MEAYRNYRPMQSHRMDVQREKISKKVLEMKRTYRYNPSTTLTANIQALCETFSLSDDVRDAIMEVSLKSFIAGRNEAIILKSNI
jgi:hypothetical protein